MPHSTHLGALKWALLLKSALLAPGISGLSLYLPPYRVQLDEWCQWNDESWTKIRAVVGRSFRMRGPQHNVYTLAASAALRLIRDYDINPAQVGFLALGTESSSDNSAGAVIVKGMINDGLRANGQSQLARDCEVPEFKQACLGGVYGLKAALRYLATDGVGRQAIVICADVAEYAIGSTGEPTQGAGAVALLVNGDADLLEVDLAAVGSDSQYRIADFRKPFTRFRQSEREDGQMQDLPVFNGRYSTNCYIDATRHAMAAMLAKRPGPSIDYFDDVDAVFIHRPYHRMPATGWVMSYLFALAADGPAGQAQLRTYCRAAGLDADMVLAELLTEDPFEGREMGDGEAYPWSRKLRGHLLHTEVWDRIIGTKLWLGAEAMKDLGNLYTAALPAWLAAGLAHAHRDGIELAGQEWLALGYGSGDAAEAIPMRVAVGWKAAAAKINFEAALLGPIDLSQQNYVALHEGQPDDLPPLVPNDEFVIDRVGTNNGPNFYDLGIEYYRHVVRAQPAG
ncbi:hydroxymethylglutaryl-CoA synthase family protein [Cryobacterium psychrophilum]|uniref:Hydroxymethylglutaryl-CoA synthase n=1 Tax=Cryobacterium psychrophilum TaxID=41988 RepID=A0A4Y8KL96_9MICO|nr:hydroxymethylglutaryl-CoA synthase family protein [Cryobacterium psychrophilum]TDW28411.1 hydroxymethylglutaryl-CoA synthase [Cryobacterium psychrophilum]TFD75093.1 hydroxymethylglutaryl-CoA synthase [Cryobacterium psychrophilum]